MILVNNQWNKVIWSIRSFIGDEKSRVEVPLLIPDVHVLGAEGSLDLVLVVDIVPGLYIFTQRTRVKL